MLKTFDDILNIKNGKNQKIVENPKGKYPIYGSGGVMGYADDYICKANTVVIGRKGSINNPLFVEEPFWNVDTAFGLEANISLLEPKYLYYFCRNYDFERLNKTVTIPSLTKSDLLQVKIDVPKISDQKIVISQLQTVEKVISLRKNQLDELDDLIKSRFIEMFGDPFVNPKEFEIIPFEQLVEYMGDIGSNGANSVVSANLIMSDTEDYALMVRTTNFTNNDFVNNVKYVSKEVYDFFRKSKVYGRELIFNKIGSAGINFIMPNLNRPVSLGLNQIMVRTNDKICMTYLHSLLNTEYGKHQINSRVQGAVTKSITKGAIKELPILLPPIELQNQFAEFVQQANKSKSAVQKTFDETQVLFDSLMQKYFR